MYFSHLTYANSIFTHSLTHSLTHSYSVLLGFPILHLILSLFCIIVASLYLVSACVVMPLGLVVGCVLVKTSPLVTCFAHEIRSVRRLLYFLPDDIMIFVLLCHVKCFPQLILTNNHFN